MCLVTKIPIGKHGTNDGHDTKKEMEADTDNVSRVLCLPRVSV